MTGRRVASTGSDHRVFRLGWLGGFAAGGLTWLLIGGWVGAAVSIPAGLLAGRFIRRMEPNRRRDRQRALGDLPLAADLLAASLRAGAPTERAVGTVAVAIGGPLGTSLLRVRDGLRMGLDPSTAWAALRTPAEAKRLGDAVLRGVDSGAAVARALTRVADDVRAARAATVEATASRVGVLIVLPLGLCFLPAFVFAGIAPVIVAVLGDALR
jgi:Flp pilus assembly protein TadB